MKTVDRLYESIVEVKRSKFISYLLPIDRFKEFHKKLKTENPKANHIVWAFRKFNKEGQIEEGSSDDGEPKGCAGVPTLNTLRGKDLLECGILTVRYFGGVKLGTGGMVRAYTKSAREVIGLADLKEWAERKSIEIECEYSSLREIEYKVKKFDLKICSKEFLSDRVKLHIDGDKDTIDNVFTK